MPVAKEQIRQIIADNNISSVADVYTLLRDGFKDILQELMEAELDATLGYEKNQKGDMGTANKRNGYSPKKLKSQYGEFQIDVPRDRNGEFEPKMDAAVPQLGPGAEPADSPLRGEADTIPIKKKSLGQGTFRKRCCPQPYSVGIYSIAGKPQSYSRGRVWAEPTKRSNQDALFLVQKNRNLCIITCKLAIL